MFRVFKVLRDFKDFKDSKDLIVSFGVDNQTFLSTIPALHVVLTNQKYERW